jgi:hypothetical protein
MKARFIVALDFDAQGRWGNAPQEEEAKIQNVRFNLEEALQAFVADNSHLLPIKSYSLVLRERRGAETTDLTKLKLRRS